MLCAQLSVNLAQGGQSHFQASLRGGCLNHQMVGLSARLAFVIPGFRLRLGNDFLRLGNHPLHHRSIFILRLWSVDRHRSRGGRGDFRLCRLCFFRMGGRRHARHHLADVAEHLGAGQTARLRLLAGSDLSHLSCQVFLGLGLSHLCLQHLVDGRGGRGWGLISGNGRLRMALGRRGNKFRAGRSRGNLCLGRRSLESRGGSRLRLLVNGFFLRRGLRERILGNIRLESGGWLLRVAFAIGGSRLLIRSLLFIPVTVGPWRLLVNPSGILLISGLRSLVLGLSGSRLIGGLFPAVLVNHIFL